MAKENKTAQPLLCHRSFGSGAYQEAVQAKQPADAGAAPDIFKVAGAEQPEVVIEVKTYTSFGLCQLERCPLFDAKTSTCLDVLEKRAAIKATEKLDSIAADVAAMLQVQSAGEA
jgi:hypothetical protein